MFPLFVIILLPPTDTENFRFKSHVFVSDQGTMEHIGAILAKVFMLDDDMQILSLMQIV